MCVDRCALHGDTRKYLMMLIGELGLTSTSRQESILVLWEAMTSLRM